jgi:hypothetical protein
MKGLVSVPFSKIDSKVEAVVETEKTHWFNKGFFYVLFFSNRFVFVV